MVFNVPTVRRESQQEEKHAEDTFALGDPSDGFDVERVKGEKGSNEKTAPGTAGKPLQNEEEENHIAGMEQDAGGVMAGGIEVEELAIQGVGEPVSKDANWPVRKW